jgi:DNA-binding CsgD family transcriptional regulator
MKNLVFLLVLNLIVIKGFSSCFIRNNFSNIEINFSKVEPNFTLKKLFKKGIETHLIDTPNLIIKHCKSVFIDIYHSAINNITNENWTNCIGLGHNNSLDIQLINELNLKHFSSSSIIFLLSGIIVLLCLWIALLIIRSYKYKNEKNSLSVIHTQNELLKKEFERLELTENLKETAEDLNASILTIKKVALLKKHLENIVDDKSPSYNEKDTLKKLKLSLNSFFDNYRELSQIMQKKLNVDKIVNFIKKDHPEITDKEIKVIEYIALNFTSKEIALLMDKSEKSVEYYRTQIRKKIKLNSSSTLEEYLNSRLM